mgnify:CR=1 FL=1
MSAQPERRPTEPARRCGAEQVDCTVLSLTLYRWEVDEERKGDFKMAWNLAMLALRKQCGAAASVALDGSDGVFITTILWPASGKPALSDVAPLAQLPVRSVKEEFFVLPLVENGTADCRNRGARLHPCDPK